MTRIKLLVGTALAAIIATSAVTMGASTGFPGMPWDQAPPDARTATGAASADGATLRVTATYGDPEQTVLSYVISASPEDGIGGIDAPVRLLLDDGTALPLVWNAADPTRGAVGSLVFPPVPDGANHVVLEEES